MANEILSRDQNFVTVLGAITNDSAQEIRMLRVDPITGRVLVNATGVTATTVNGLSGDITLAAGTGISISTDGGTDTITITNTGDLSVTLADVSANSGTAPLSIYTMTSTIPVEFRTSDGNTLLYLDETNERVGIGTSTASAKLHTVSTTEQLRLGYDVSNYTAFTVNSSGGLTLTNSNATATGLLTLSGNGASTGNGPGLTITNTDATARNASVGSYNLAFANYRAGNGAVIGQFGSTYSSSGTSDVFGTSGFYVTTRTDHPIVFGTGASWSEKMRISSTGLTGIGVTDSDQLLTVGTNTTSTVFGSYPAISIRNSNAAGNAGFNMVRGVGVGNLKARAYIDGTNTLYFGTYSNNDFILTSADGNRIWLKSSTGYTGFNTSGPDRMVDILDASNPQLRLTHTDGSVYTDLQTNSSGDFVVNPTGCTIIQGPGITSSTTSFVVEDSAGTDMFVVKDDGQITVGKAYTMTTDGIYSTLRSSSAITNGTGATIGQVVGAYFSEFFLAGSNAFAASRGMGISMLNNNTHSGNIIQAGYYSPRNNTAASRANSLIGITAQPLISSTAGTVATVTGFNCLFDAVLAAASTVTNLYGVRVGDLANSGTITNTYGVHVGDITTGTQTNTPFSFYASDANAYNYFAGNVGIGTTTPGSQLDVSSATGAITRYTRTATTTNASLGQLNFYNGATRAAIIDVIGDGAIDSGAFDFYTTPTGGSVTQRMRITSAGNVGIGTTTPDRLLHVENSDAVTNAVTYAQRLSHITSGTATTSFGTGIEYELENASGTNRVAATQEFTWSDATNASEDATYTLKLMRAGTLSTAITVSSTGALTASAGIAAASSNLISWTSRSRMQSPSDGVIELSNAAETDFNRLQFGGTTSSFPSLKRSSTGLQVRLADDSAYAPFTVGSLNVNAAYTLPTTDGTSGYVLTTDGAGTVTWAAGGGGGGSMTLLASGSGTVNYASASNVDTVAISGLTNLDTLLVYFSITPGGDDDGSWLLYTTTDSQTIVRVDPGFSLGTGYSEGSSVLRASASANTTYIGTTTAGNATPQLVSNRVTGLTDWTGSWTLALRHTAGGTGSGDTDWTWAVYKVAGQ